MNSLRSLSLVPAFIILSLITLQCGGGGGGGDDDDDTTTEAEGDDAAVASVANGGMGDGVGASAGSANANVSALVKSAITRQITQTLNETQTIECGVSGDMTMVIEGTVTIQSESDISINMTSTMTVNACSESSCITLDDASECCFTAVMDGTMTCEAVGSLTALVFSCSTSSACSGTTMTLNGVSHTFGVDLEATMVVSEAADGAQPDFDGTFCIDGVEFPIEDVLDQQVPQGDLTCQ